MGKIFNQVHYKVYGEKAIEFALLAVGALIFGQLLSEKAGLSFELAALGFVLFVLGFVVSYTFLSNIRGGEKNDAA